MSNLAGTPDGNFSRAPNRGSKTALECPECRYRFAGQPGDHCPQCDAIPCWYTGKEEHPILRGMTACANRLAHACRTRDKRAIYHESRKLTRYATEIFNRYIYD